MVYYNILYTTRTALWVFREQYERKVLQMSHLINAFWEVTPQVIKASSSISRRYFVSVGQLLPYSLPDIVVRSFQLLNTFTSIHYFDQFSTTKHFSYAPCTLFTINHVFHP